MFAILLRDGCGVEDCVIDERLNSLAGRYDSDSLDGVMIFFNFFVDLVKDEMKGFLIGLRNSSLEVAGRMKCFWLTLWVDGVTPLESSNRVDRVEIGYEGVVERVWRAEIGFEGVGLERVGLEGVGLERVGGVEIGYEGVGFERTWFVEIDRSIWVWILPSVGTNFFDLDFVADVLAVVDDEEMFLVVTRTCLVEEMSSIFGFEIVDFVIGTFFCVGWNVKKRKMTLNSFHPQISVQLLKLVYTAQLFLYSVAVIERIDSQNLKLPIYSIAEDQKSTKEQLKNPFVICIQHFSYVCYEHFQIDSSLWSISDTF